MRPQDGFSENPSKLWSFLLPRSHCFSYPGSGRKGVFLLDLFLNRGGGIFDVVLRWGLDDRFLLHLSKKNGRLDLLSRLYFYFECHGFVIILMKRLGTFYQPGYIAVCVCIYIYILTFHSCRICRDSRLKPRFVPHKLRLLPPQCNPPQKMGLMIRPYEPPVSLNKAGFFVLRSLLFKKAICSPMSWAPLSKVREHEKKSTDHMRPRMNF